MIVQSHSPPISLRTWIVILAVGVLIFILNIDYTAVNLTLVPISEEIHVDLNNLQWLLSAYVLVWAAFVVPAGRLADLYGKRNALIGGLLIFMVGSCLAGIGQSIEILILGRVLQGIGAAVFSAPAWAFIFTSASPERQGFVMGVLLSFGGFGLATGPTLAGFIIEAVSWRWIFYINIPLGVLVIATLLVFSDKDVFAQVKQKIDVLGILLLSSGLCICVYALNQMEVWGATSPKLLGTAAFGVCLLGAYYFWDRLQEFRMVPPQLFRNKAYMAATFGEFFMAINFSMVLVLMGLYLQNTLHYSTYEAGLIFISMTISMGFLSPIGGKLIDAFGVRRPMIFGALLTACGLGMMTFLNTDPTLGYVISSLFLVGTGLGTYFTATSTAMMRSVPQEDLNVASGVFMMVMMVGNTLSIILSTSFVVIFGRNFLLKVTQENGFHLSSWQQKQLTDVIAKVEHSAAQLTTFSSEQVPFLLQWIDQAFVYGFSLNMMFGVLCALIAVGLTIWGVRNKDKTQPKIAVPNCH
ncbi:MAG: hypothetical protein A2X70_04675 [Alphaproteobacteria bacterium GWC2_42_16]|nr:MAG: hypothetical protein A2X70_04675 [Alphaproteobacteria bacterium GWC2_42_16]OFW73281.1 MAG: hypothetical protein A2Z80_03855 [Alphaproteobacteria bacterium GWA2_41_27]OFW81886.1 MAG: hypothetical protein A3E50_07190 [Alphaproteobacteria bacterium RIFCSPHIGHO2_12_FULL_42_100]OFW84877.1 MAG: hypothetical protein A2W06_03390 [Alphaproteobacteria bacterium RBG_16_42_14]OFW90996.1 MAG: hypothetical protein A3C41_04200 [Alphaproteobacteria bacterium RIFCSPHIGHO2_02_FULL_42_30]OFW91441.1 MAG: 